MSSTDSRSSVFKNKLEIENVMINTHLDLNDIYCLYGLLSITNNNEEYCLRWTKYEDGKKKGGVLPSRLNSNADPLDPAIENFLDITTGNEVTTSDVVLKKETKNYELRIPLSEIFSIRKFVPHLAKSYIIIRTKAGIDHNPLFFTEGLNNFFNFLQSITDIYKSPNDSNLYLVNDGTHPLERSAVYQNQSYLSSLVSFGKKIVPINFSRSGREKSEPSQPKQEHSNELHYAIGTFQMLDTDEILTTSPTLPQIEREKPLSELEWKNAFDKDGKIVDPKAIKKRIFYGGVEDSIRIEVWKFLLGYYTWESTETERKLIREQKHQNYDIVRNQWQSIIPDQEKNFSKFRNRRSKIERDVVRTDRSDPNFESLESQYIIWLRKILITYCFFNWDIGYVQGMNDLVAVILVIQNDEADGFWCFKGMMDKFGKHFSKDQNGILTQLEKLRKLMSFLDPQFYKYLGDIDALKFFFVYRWILIVFRREFSLEQVKILWEAILTDYYHKDFMLFFATAILMKEKERIISEGMNFDSILKHITLLSEKMDAVELLNNATKLYYHFDQTTDEEVKSYIFN